MVLRVAAGAGSQRHRRWKTETNRNKNWICTSPNCDGTNKGPFLFPNSRVLIILGKGSAGRCRFPAAHHQEVQANGVSQVNTSLPAWVGAGDGGGLYLTESRFTSALKAAPDSSRSPDGSQLDARFSGPLVSARAARSSPAFGTGREIAANC